MRLILPKKELYHSLLIGLFISIAVTLLSMGGYLLYFENNALDFLIFWSQEKPSQDIVFVDIDDEDFYKVFDTKRPLSPSKLAKIVELIRLAGARVIALDLDIRDFKIKDKNLQRDYKELFDAIYRSEEVGVPIVAAVPLEKKESEHIHFEQGIPVYKEPTFFPPNGVRWGVVAFPVYRDRIVRHMYLKGKFQNGDLFPFFPLAVVMAASGKSQEILKEELIGNDKKYGKLIINFIGDKTSFNRIKSSVLLKIDPAKIASDNIFADKIVVVGATFPSSRDYFATPKWRMAGAEIICNAIETILHKTIRSPSHLLEFILEVIIGALTAISFAYFGVFRTFIISVFAIIPVTAGASFLTFYSFNSWLNFAVPTIGVFIHVIVHHIRENSYLKEELTLLQVEVQKRDEDIKQLRSMLSEENKKR